MGNRSSGITNLPIQPRVAYYSLLVRWIVSFNFLTDFDDDFVLTASAKDIRVEQGHVLAANLYDTRDKQSCFTSIDPNHSVGLLWIKGSWELQN